MAAGFFQNLTRDKAKFLSFCPRGDEMLLLYQRLCDIGLVIESQRTSSMLPLLALALPIGDIISAFQNDKDRLYEFLSK